MPGVSSSILLPLSRLPPREGASLLLTAAWRFSLSNAIQSRALEAARDASGRSRPRTINFAYLACSSSHLPSPQRSQQQKLALFSSAPPRRSFSNSSEGGASSRSKTVSAGVAIFENTNSEGSGPLEVYEQLLEQHQISEEPHQRVALQRLQTLFDQLFSGETAYNPPIPREHQTTPDENGNASLLATIQSYSLSVLGQAPQSATIGSQSTPVSAPHGIYLHGDVGCGKTFLMDVFYDCCDVERKRRVHFHAFMLDVHRRIHKWRYEPGRNRKTDHDPIPPLARQLAAEAWLLCLDEFQVNDVVDATILHRLFRQLYTHGVVVVMTSNRPPAELYKNGLQRDLFLPFIELLKEKNLIHDLDSGVDFRLTGVRDAVEVFLSPLGDATEQRIQQLFIKLTRGEPVREEEVTLTGRKLRVPRASRGVARYTFSELCAANLGAADYIGLSKNYHTVFVEGIPQMTVAQKNEARRFITLVDELYEHHCKLVCSAAAPPHQLFVGAPAAVSGGGGGGSSSSSVNNKDHLRRAYEYDADKVAELFTGEEEKFMFQRAQSRLFEMQSQQYLALAHNPTGEVSHKRQRRRSQHHEHAHAPSHHQQQHQQHQQHHEPQLPQH